MQQFTKYGSTYTEIKRQDQVAIYTKTDGNRFDCYEIVIVQIAKSDRYINGQLITKEGTEFYPSNEQWGKLGWTTNSRPRAEEIFSRELAKLKEPS